MTGPPPYLKLSLDLALASVLFLSDKYEIEQNLSRTRSSKTNKQLSFGATVCFNGWHPIKENILLSRVIV